MSHKRGLIVLLFLCAVGLGCLKNQSTSTATDTQDLFYGAETNSQNPAPEYAAEEVTDAEVAPAAKAPATSLAERYTGAVVYTDPANCLPCRHLESDLQALQRRGWSVCWWGSKQFTGTEDWIFSKAETRHKSIPTVEYFLDGKLIDTHVGYSTAGTRNERRDALADIVKKHPQAAD